MAEPSGGGWSATSDGDAKWIPEDEPNIFQHRDISTSNLRNAFGSVTLATAVHVVPTPGLEVNPRIITLGKLVLAASSLRNLWM